MGGWRKICSIIEQGKGRFEFLVLCLIGKLEFVAICNLFTFLIITFQTNKSLKSNRRHNWPIVLQSAVSAFLESQAFSLSSDVTLRQKCVLRFPSWLPLYKRVLHHPLRHCWLPLYSLMSTNRLSSSLSRRPSASVSDHLQKPSYANANVAKWCREWYGDSDLAHHRCHGRAQSLEKLPRKGIVLRQYVDTPWGLNFF